MQFIYELRMFGKFFLRWRLRDLNVKLMERFLQLMIRAYQLTLSPFIGQHCRFTPSCSRYASEAIEVHGAWRGSWLAIKRIGRCHPFCDGGLDPVPPRESTD